MTSLQMLVASDAAEGARKAYWRQWHPHMVIIGKGGQILRVHRGYSEEGVETSSKTNEALAQ
jgi:hypothetical protein